MAGIWALKIRNGLADRPSDHGRTGRRKADDCFFAGVYRDFGSCFPALSVCTEESDLPVIRKSFGEKKNKEHIIDGDNV